LFVHLNLNPSLTTGLKKANYILEGTKCKAIEKYIIASQFEATSNLMIIGG